MVLENISFWFGRVRASGREKRKIEKRRREEEEEKKKKKKKKKKRKKEEEKKKEIRNGIGVSNTWLELFRTCMKFMFGLGIFPTKFFVYT